MERTLISVNWPNGVSITIMFLLGWLIVGLIWQLIQKYQVGGAQVANNAGGF